MQNFPNTSSFQAQFDSVNGQQTYLPNHPNNSLQPRPDPDSLEAFKQNIQDIQDHVLQLQNTARTLLTAIQNAYHVGASPKQAGFVQTLEAELAVIAEKMRASGVGALPLLTSSSSSAASQVGVGMDVDVPAVHVPSEKELMESIKRDSDLLFEKHRRIQQSAGVAANLLDAPEGVGMGARTGLMVK
ncbi:hypothetical protein BDQ12DRAFT_658376 [Crucibulum laeve]|uniref:Uncharacterized protein n=1 Tax=Crucibulum laeve TaxID=68775 RepID=A0A5C3LK94_9AGAR|nr:hypothetical protein BDQ12DRAFT_658376 [Crucibulum laeve]